MLQATSEVAAKYRVGGVHNRRSNFDIHDAFDSGSRLGNNRMRNAVDNISIAFSLAIVRALDTVFRAFDETNQIFSKPAVIRDPTGGWSKVTTVFKNSKRSVVSNPSQPLKGKVWICQFMAVN